MHSTPKTTSTRAASAPAEEIRLNHLLAQVGIASRRACDAIIAAGRVRVNGRVVREMGTKVTVGVDAVDVDGTAIGKPPKRLVLLMHKPKGLVSTVTDPEGRPTVADLARRVVRTQRLFPVGRLDVNTTGALLMTNDGLLCYKLTHPRYGVARVYHVRVRGRFDETTERRLERMAQEGTREHPRARASARRDPRGHRERDEQRERKRQRGRPGVEVVAKLAKETVLKVTLLEGRNRQVRNMIEAVGLHVTALKRVSFGPVSIRGLPVGAIRSLDRKELDRLEAAVGGRAGGDR